MSRPPRSPVRTTLLLLIIVIVGITIAWVGTHWTHATVVVPVIVGLLTLASMLARKLS